MPEPYDLMVRFAAYTGLRSGEIAALRARHIRLDAGKVDVVTAVSEIHGALVEHDPKSYSSRRAVTLPAHGVRFHDLRHTCAALLIAEGAHPEAIQQPFEHHGDARPLRAPAAVA